MIRKTLAAGAMLLGAGLPGVLLAQPVAQSGARAAAQSAMRTQDVLPFYPRRAVAPMVLRLPASARILAMANAGVASTDADALLYNPGMLSAARGASVSMQTYGSGGTGGAVATVTTLGSLFFGVGAQFVRWNVGPTQPAREDERYRERLLGGGASLYAREGIPSSSTAITFGIARTIKGLRLGASAKFAEDRIGLSNDGTVAFDIGMMRSVGQVNLAITAQNLGFGTRLDGQESVLPRRLGVGFGGAGYALSEHWDLGAQAQLTMENDFFRPAGGVELVYVPIEGVQFALRSGLRLPRESNESLVTGGFGATLDRFSLDYAFEPFRNGFAVSHRVGVRIR
ncbi:MAG: hypothetical protein V4617_04660 [Gemmatimonadota bacterium]